MAFTKTQKTCGSNECRRINGLKTNYKLLHNNWAKYLKSLCRSRKDPNLTKHFDEIFLIDLLKKQKWCLSKGSVLCTEVANRNSTTWVHRVGEKAVPICFAKILQDSKKAD
jgi:hypothetical protein